MKNVVVWDDYATLNSRHSYKVCQDTHCVFLGDALGSWCAWYNRIHISRESNLIVKFVPEIVLSLFCEVFRVQLLFLLL